ncbi:MAG: hypothetical protein NT096_00090 [Proteobacteria bacterium]|nr:hypothetical protein [Pseudomonadota bacterium]
MAKNKPDLTGILSHDEIQGDFTALINSCAEGYTGEWDSSGEGRDSFIAMAQLLKRLARHYKVDVSDTKEI